MIKLIELVNEIESSLIFFILWFFKNELYLILMFKFIESSLIVLKLLLFMIFNVKINRIKFNFFKLLLFVNDLHLISMIKLIESSLKKNLIESSLFFKKSLLLLIFNDKINRIMQWDWIKFKKKWITLNYVPCM